MLLATRRGDWLREHVNFMKGRAWVRHDEHYHVDFRIACGPLG
jgi:penicillin-insensitive murein endopeptidase